MTAEPYQPPRSELVRDDAQGPRYAGFWIRFWATIIDTVLSMLITVPLLYAFYGGDYWNRESMITGPIDVLINYVLPALAVVLFWIFRSATPGKMAFGLIIVDAKTGNKPSVAQLIGRYLGYYVSIIPLLIGFVWVGLDKRKQGWHDKLAGTVVVKRR